MSADLFRKEVYAAQLENHMGVTAIYQPLPARIMVLGATAICVALFAFLLMGEYTRKAKVKGFLEPTTGVVTVWAPQAGLLQEVYVQEGQTVTKGEPLFVIATERASLQSADSQAKILKQLVERRENLRQSLDNERQLGLLEIQSLKATHKKLMAEREQIDMEIAIAQKKVVSQNSVLASYRTLQKNHFVSNLEAEQAAHKLLDYEAALQALNKRKFNLQEDLERASQDIELRRLRSEKEQKAVERQMFALEQEITEHQQNQASVILAPSSGVIATLPVHRNQMIVGNQRLISLVPENTTLKATLLVPSKAAGFLRSRQQVVIRYTAFPYQKFGTVKGEVVEIDQSLTLPGESVSPVLLEEPAYLVSVSLNRQTIEAYGARYGLKAGMTLEADVRLETRTVMEWLFEPIWSFTRKV